MNEPKVACLDRRDLLVRLVPACSLVCLATGSLQALGSARQEGTGGVPAHKFDAALTRTLTTRQDVSRQYGNLISFIKVLEKEIPREELLRLLRLYSAEAGRAAAARQVKRSPDTSFESFVSTFRPPNYATTLTHEVVTDTEKVFELRVTECVWAAVFRDAGLSGEIGHAAICNMDFHWPRAFNPRITMERDKTLMQGHDHCNHRYIDTSV